MARRSLTFPILLVALGILLLLSNLRIVPWEAWHEIARFWPVLLIALGVDLLLARRGGWGWLGGAILLVLVLFSGVSIFDAVAPASWTVRGEETFQEGLQGAARAEVELVCGAGPIEVTAGSDATLLASGDVALRWDEELTRERSQADGTARLTVRRDARFPFHVVRTAGWFRVALNPSVPLDLSVRAGAGLARIDLTGLAVERVEVHTGAGSTTVIFPSRGEVRATVEGGVGEVTVIVPEGVALRVVAEGLGSVDVPDGLLSEGKVRVSPGYEAAADRIELEARVGVGRLVVKRSAS